MSTNSCHLGAQDQFLLPPRNLACEVEDCSLERALTDASLQDSSELPPCEAGPQEDVAPWEEGPLRTWGSAQIMTLGWDPDSEPLFAKDITVCFGANAESKRWTNKTLPMEALLAQLCTHKEGPKDGLAFMGGELVGERRIANA